MKNQKSNDPLQAWGQELQSDLDKYYEEFKDQKKLQKYPQYGAMSAIAMAIASINSSSETSLFLVDSEIKKIATQHFRSLQGDKGHFPLPFIDNQEPEISKSLVQIYLNHLKRFQEKVLSKYHNSSSSISKALHAKQDEISASMEALKFRLSDTEVLDYKLNYSKIQQIPNPNSLKKEEKIKILNEDDNSITHQKNLRISIKLQQPDHPRKQSTSDTSTNIQIKPIDEIKEKIKNLEEKLQILSDYSESFNNANFSNNPIFSKEILKQHSDKNYLTKTQARDIRSAFEDPARRRWNFFGKTRLAHCQAFICSEYIKTLSELDKENINLISNIMASLNDALQQNNLSNEQIREFSKNVRKELNGIKDKGILNSATEKALSSAITELNSIDKNLVQKGIKIISSQFNFDGLNNSRSSTLSITNTQSLTKEVSSLRYLAQSKEEIQQLDKFDKIVKTECEKILLKLDQDKVGLISGIISSLNTALQQKNLTNEQIRKFSETARKELSDIKVNDFLNLSTKQALSRAIEEVNSIDKNLIQKGITRISVQLEIYRMQILKSNTLIKDVQSLMKEISSMKELAKNQSQIPQLDDLEKSTRKLVNDYFEHKKTIQRNNLNRYIAKTYKSSLFFSYPKSNHEPVAEKLLKYVDNRGGKSLNLTDLELIIKDKPLKHIVAGLLKIPSSCIDFHKEWIKLHKAYISSDAHLSSSIR